MPVGPINTKAQKQAVVHTEMSKFKQGTLHSGSKHGPKVKSRGQAIAIALSESGQSKKPPPRGGGESKPGYDRSGHRPGNPGFPEGRHVPNQTYAQEQREHWGSKAEGKPMGERGKVGNIDCDRRGSHLVEEGGAHHTGQPGGTSVGHGAEQHGAEHHKGHGMGGAAHSFKPPAAHNAHGFGHGEHKAGPLRLSGHSGAHRLGKK